MAFALTLLSHEATPVRRRAWLIRLLVATALTGLLADCGTSADDPVATMLAGKTFVSQTVTEAGAPHALVAGTELSIYFHDNHEMSARAGCNYESGSLHILDSRLVLNEVIITMMGCDWPRAMQDGWYFDFLESSPMVTLGTDSLALDGGSTHIEYLDQEIAQGADPTLYSIFSIYICAMVMLLS